MAVLAIFASVILLVLCLGTAHLYLTRDEFWDHARLRIYTPVEERRRDMLIVLGAAVVAGLLAAGVFFLLCRI
jgi:hypothetical protein